MLLVWQAFRDEMRGLRPRISTVASREKGTGAGLPSNLLLVRPLLPATGHRRRVLPYGGQEARLQTRLRTGESKR